MKFRYFSDFREGTIRNEILLGVDKAFVENDPEIIVRKFLSTNLPSEPKGRIFVIGFGKGARKMFQGVRSLLGNKISDAAVIIPKDEDGKIRKPFLPGDHPIPLYNTMRSSEKLLEILRNPNEEDIVIALVSGGGSALFELLDDRFNLDQFNVSVQCAMSKGADIYELNAIRYLFSKIKGGGLLKYTFPAKVISLIISDVPGDDINVVASGPLAGPPNRTFIKKTLDKFGQRCFIPTKKGRVESVQSYSAKNHLILTNRDFVLSVSNNLKKNGIETVTLKGDVRGTTDDVARGIVETLRGYYSLVRRPLFLVGGGETVTNVLGDGKGGRNLELCLRFLLRMNINERFTFGSFGTDGIDGSSGAMGGIVDQRTLKILGKEYITESLLRSESLMPLMKTKDVLFTGRTGTNVSDVFVAYYAGRIHSEK